MQVLSFAPIWINEKDFNMGALVGELGGESNVRLSLHRDKGTAIKTALLDETQIDADTSAQDLAQAIIDAHDKALATTAQDKVARIKVAKDAMNTDLYNSVYAYFGTDDKEAAGVWERSWQIKKDNAASYTGDGLIVIHTTTTYDTPGVALDTELKIQTYYGELVTERVIPFDKYRDQRVAQFLTEKATIEAE